MFVKTVRLLKLFTTPTLDEKLNIDVYEFSSTSYATYCIFLQSFTMCGVLSESNSVAMLALNYCVYQRSSAVAAISNTDRPKVLS